jgi:hypothetical protein
MAAFEATAGSGVHWCCWTWESLPYSSFPIVVISSFSSSVGVRLASGGPLIDGNLPHASQAVDAVGAPAYDPMYGPAVRRKRFSWIWRLTRPISASTPRWGRSTTGPFH